MKWLRRLFGKETKDVFLDRFAPGFEITQEEFEKAERASSRPDTTPTDSKEWHPYVGRGKEWHWICNVDGALFVDSGIEVERNRKGDVTLQVGRITIRKSLDDLLSRDQLRREFWKAKVIHPVTMLNYGIRL